MKKVAVALSGGVDSAAAALILKREGYEVCGVTYRLQPGNSSDIEDAKRVCQALDIEHFVFDYQKEFKEFVINPFIDCYLNAQTPNPCIFCNKAIKFGRYLEDAMAMGCEYISTGHYAKVTEDENGCHIFRGLNEKKEQSYVLYNLNQNIMKHLVLPLGNWEHTKDELREMVGEAGIPVAHRPESQDICFIKDGDYASYIEERREVPIKGSFVDSEGKILGPHKGFYRYTVGQRKGLGIALGAPAFVTGIDPLSGNVTLSLDEKKLFSKAIRVENFNFLAKEEPSFPLRCQVKMRYKSPFADCTVEKDKNSLIITLDNEGRAPTKGQSAVLYAGRELLGGGIITEIL